MEEIFELVGISIEDVPVLHIVLELVTKILEFSCVFGIGMFILQLWSKRKYYHDSKQFLEDSTEHLVKIEQQAVKLTNKVKMKELLLRVFYTNIGIEERRQFLGGKDYLNPATTPFKDEMAIFEHTLKSCLCCLLQLIHKTIPYSYLITPIQRSQKTTDSDNNLKLGEEENLYERGAQGTSILNGYDCLGFKDFSKTKSRNFKELVKEAGKDLTGLTKNTSRFSSQNKSTCGSTTTTPNGLGNSLHSKTKGNEGRIGNIEEKGSLQSTVKGTTLKGGTGVVGVTGENANHSTKQKGSLKNNGRHHNARNERQHLVKGGNGEWVNSTGEGGVWNWEGESLEKTMSISEFVNRIFRRNEKNKENYGFIIPIIDCMELNMLPSEWIPLAYIDTLKLYFPNFRIIYYTLKQKLKKIHNHMQNRNILNSLFRRLDFDAFGNDNCDFIMMGAVSLNKSLQIYNSLLNFILFQNHVSACVRAKAISFFKFMYADYILQEDKITREHVLLKLNYLEEFYIQ